MHGRKLPVLLAAALTASTAHAGTGWDWTEGFDHWRPATLQWAHDIHPEHPDFQELEQYVEPPPDEPWCHDPPTPDMEDCYAHDDMLDEWVRYYLEIPANLPIPRNLIPYPYECPSLCSQ